MGGALVGGQRSPSCTLPGVAVLSLTSHHGLWFLPSLAPRPNLSLPFILQTTKRKGKQSYPPSPKPQSTFIGAGGERAFVLYATSSHLPSMASGEGSQCAVHSFVSHVTWRAAGAVGPVHKGGQTRPQPWDPPCQCLGRPRCPVQCELPTTSLQPQRAESFP